MYRRLQAILVVTCAMLMPRSMHAQKSPVAVSLDVSVAEAEQVFEGHIDNIRETSGTGETSRTPISIDVDQIIKGKPAKHLSMNFVPNWYRWEFHPRFIRSAEQLPRSKHILFCVMPVFRGNSKVIAIDLDSPELQELSSSLTVLRQPELVLRVAKAAALRYPTAAQQLKTTLVEAATQDSLKGSQFWGCDNIILASDDPER